MLLKISQTFTSNSRKEQDKQVGTQITTTRLKRKAMESKLKMF
jgi:hypothetical protein